MIINANGITCQLFTKESYAIGFSRRKSGLRNGAIQDSLRFAGL